MQTLDRLVLRRVSTGTRPRARHRFEWRRATSATIGRVSFSKTGKTLYYAGKAFQSLKGSGFKANYFDTASGDEYWISGCKRDGRDRLYGEGVAVEIDEDVRAEYWTNDPQPAREQHQGRP